MNHWFFGDCLSVLLFFAYFAPENQNMYTVNNGSYIRIYKKEVRRV